MGDRDHARTLTPEGLDEARRVGVRMVERAEVPNRIITSTALRCRQTRDALCAGLGLEVETEFEDALYNASAERILDALACQDEPGSLLVLAHNPGVSMLALGLCAQRPAAAAHQKEEASQEAQAEGLLRKQWVRMQGGFAPAATARFAVRGSWPELAPHTTDFLRFEEAPGS
jgi:phosphohistidine phosphatase SixA